jgi:predicted unusual protein kinase regulating ubiquinone biosynthesis (AarF/ABC1/UbiB family)
MLLCRETLTALGPSFIKAGQVLASRPDIVRADYMEELCVLQDDVPSFSDDVVRIFAPPKLTSCLMPAPPLQVC